MFPCEIEHRLQIYRHKRRATPSSTVSLPPQNEQDVLLLADTAMAPSNDPATNRLSEFVSFRRAKARVKRTSWQAARLTTLNQLLLDFNQTPGPCFTENGVATTYRNRAYTSCFF